METGGNALPHWHVSVHVLEKRQQQRNAEHVQQHQTRAAAASDTCSSSRDSRQHKQQQQEWLSSRHEHRTAVAWRSYVRLRGHAGCKLPRQTLSRSGRKQPCLQFWSSWSTSPRARLHGWRVRCTSCSSSWRRPPPQPLLRLGSPACCSKS